MGRYTIQQGEHVPRIADEHGFHSYRRLWDDPGNQALKQLRRNPNVLLPGDELFVPERKYRVERGATEQRHRFRVKTSPLVLRIVLCNVDGEPLRNAACELRLNSASVPLVTDDRGMIEHKIPKGAEEGKLIVRDHGLEHDLKIGHLDPVEEVSGERARLDNLGFFAGYAQEDAGHLRWAIEEFQCEHGLPVTGVYDRATRTKLEQVHGS